MSQAARDLLLALFSPVVGTAGFVELVGLWGGDPGYPKNVERGVSGALDDVDWLDYLVENAQTISDEKENVYFGPNPRVRPVGFGGRNGEEDVEIVVALWADADPPKDKTTKIQLDPNWKAKHRDAFAHPPLPPSARVDSGHGYHYYWFLKEPFADIAACKAMLKRIMRYVPDGDGKVTHLSRILRLPGWPNLKNPEKPLPVSLDWCDAGRRYSFEEIVRAFPERAPVTRPTHATGVQTSPQRSSRLRDAEVDVLVGLWTAGQRHALALAVLGAMRKAGWLEQDARAEIDRISAAAGDEEDRSGNVRTTWAKPIDEVAGWSELEELGIKPSLLPSLDRPMVIARDRADGRREIDLSPDDHRVVAESISALEAEKSLYRRGNNLVRVLRDERSHQDAATKMLFPAAAPRISLLPLPSLQELLSKNVVYMKMVPARDGGEPKRVHVRPPDAIVREVAARGQWPSLRPLNDVVEVPVLRPDGTVLTEAGYDPMTGLSFEPAGEVLPVDHAPTRAQAREAAELLLDLVVDFPFTHDVARGAWLALALTPLARYAFGGPTPAIVITSNKKGSGKGMLADLAAVVSIGRELARSPMPEQSEELRKRITAVAIEGVRVVLIDNVIGAFGSPAFDAVVTSTAWSDRILGESTNTPSMPLNTLWVVTGNNIQLKGDLPRRTMIVRMDSPLEHPEQRDDFKVSDLLSHAKARQPELTRAALTILKGYCAAGRPQAKLPPWGSFGGWSNLVRQAIAWSAAIDVGEARAEGDATVTTLEDNAQILVLDAWGEVDPEGKGLTAAELLTKLRSPTAEIAFERMRAAILEFSPSPVGDLPTPRQLGNKFRSIRRSVFDGRYLDMAISRGESKWRVCLTPEAQQARQQAQVGQ